jgi:protein-S-isoprenylcysteine O-methyltransferase Ste14
MTHVKQAAGAAKAPLKSGTAALRGSCAALYSALAYVFFVAVFLYSIGFVEDVAVPSTIDSGIADNWPNAIAVNAALITVFALQHSVMARPGFKRVWARLVPADLERSTYVLFSSVALALLCWQWRQVPQLVWSVDQPFAAAVLRCISWLGWTIVIASTFLISHFQLFGLSQGFGQILRPRVSTAAFAVPLLYRWLRHPTYVGFILAFWAAPHMTLGHLLFAALMTGHIAVGIWFDERRALMTAQSSEVRVGGGNFGSGDAHPDRSRYAADSSARRNINSG